MSKKRFFEGMSIDTEKLDRSSVIIYDIQDRDRTKGIKQIVYVGRDSSNHILTLNDRSVLLIKIK